MEVIVEETVERFRSHPRYRGERVRQLQEDGKKVNKHVAGVWISA